MSGGELPRDTPLSPPPSADFLRACLEHAPTPAYVISEPALSRNLEILRTVKARTGCRILLALKGFAFPRVFPLLSRDLDGVCASSPHEARLGAEEFGGEVHAFAPAYSDEDFEALRGVANHLIFNSLAQWDKFRGRVEPGVECGLRINPECSTVSVEQYDPCAPGSRLGIRRKDLGDELPEGIQGLHFHTLCEQNSDALEATVQAVEQRFGDLLRGLRWLNLGGGHHITREDYDLDRLYWILDGLRSRYGIGMLYLAPGEAVALGAGVLVTRVLDVIPSDPPTLILDTSAAAHMPDVQAMPYRPRVVDAGRPGERAHTYRLGGMTCLAGDTLGDYSFDRTMRAGDRLALEDMAHYTIVKNTTFNGVRLPSICLYRGSNEVEMIREFGYEEYRRRLG